MYIDSLYIVDFQKYSKNNSKIKSFKIIKITNNLKEILKKFKIFIDTNLECAIIRNVETVQRAKKPNEHRFLYILIMQRLGVCLVHL